MEPATGVENARGAFATQCRVEQAVRRPGGRGVIAGVISIARMQITGRRGTSRPSRVVRPGHAVADPALGHDVGRPRRVVAQLAAELLDEGAHQLHVAGLPPAPHLAQQRVVEVAPISWTG